MTKIEYEYGTDDPDPWVEEVYYPRDDLGSKIDVIVGKTRRGGNRKKEKGKNKHKK